MSSVYPTSAEVKAAKEIKFDSTLWLPDQPQLRRQYSYKETPDWKTDPKRGVVTYPVCPYCGSGELDEQNKEFKVGDLCGPVCMLAWGLRYDLAGTIKRIKEGVNLRLTEKAINYSI